MTDLGAAVGGFAVAVCLGPPWIRFLRRRQVGQPVRAEMSQDYQRKAGTPVLGGALFVAGSTLVSVLAGVDPPALVALGVMWAFALLGLVDDLQKVRGGRALGLRARTKVAVGVAVALSLAYVAQGPLGLGTGVVDPLRGGVWTLGLPAYYLLVVLVVLGTVNAVNLTDGMDGLAGGLAVMALVYFVLRAQHAGMDSLAWYGWALAGGVLGFLYYNLHPAWVFMGDTGALALGGALAAFSVLTRSELLLPVVGGVFVLETLSVMAQVAAFRLFGRRVLRMSPAHHHLALSGWSETQTVGRLWLLGLGLFGLARSLWH